MSAAESAPVLTSAPFRVGRVQLARITSAMYVRKLWFLIVGFPIFGFWLIFLTSEPVLRYVAMVSILWPISIPARSVIVTNKAAKRLLQKTTAILESDALYLRAEDGTGTRIDLDRVTAIRRSGELFVIELKHYLFVVVPISAFTDAAEAERFEGTIRAFGRRTR